MMRIRPSTPPRKSGSKQRRDYLNDIVLITRAFNFASSRHSEQRRKGQAQEPYVNHLAEVAELVAETTNGNDANLVAAALLHDTIEDTHTQPNELVTLFNEDIASLVGEVTDDTTLLKAERKKIQIANAPKKSPRAKILKLADKTSNLRSIAKSPPKNWDSSRKAEYINWAVKVVEGLGTVPTGLKSHFEKAAQTARDSI